MPGPDAFFTDEDRRYVAEAGRQLDALDRLWTESGDELAKKYGGEWVAVADGRIVAHDPDSERLSLQLERTGERDKAIVRYVPKPGTEFAFCC